MERPHHPNTQIAQTGQISPENAPVLAFIGVGEPKSYIL